MDYGSKGLWVQWTTVPTDYRSSGLRFSQIIFQTIISVNPCKLGKKTKGMLGANAMKRVPAGAHLLTFEPAKRLSQVLIVDASELTNFITIITNLCSCYCILEHISSVGSSFLDPLSETNTAC